jgi:H+/Cl- antiporter ClcA
VGGGLATWITEQLDFEESDRKLIVLSGMAAAVGSLFPSPILTVMMMFELGTPAR